MSSASTRLLLRDSNFPVQRAPPNWIGACCNKLAYQLCPPSFTTRGIAERSLADSLRAVNYAHVSAISHLAFPAKPGSINNSSFARWEASATDFGSQSVLAACDRGHGVGRTDVAIQAGRPD